MEGTKSPLTSLGIMGPAIGIIVWVLNQFVFKGGEGVSVSEVSEIVDKGSMIFTAVTAIWGRWKATKKVTATGK